MCGIAGIMTRDGSKPDETQLKKLTESLKHRGPDGSGVFVDGEIGLVHTRLAIIDLATGDQPLFEPLGATLIGNGEIYNYLELKREMRDTKFTTKSDCEVPLHLYRQWGLGFAHTLRGMFALAIYDKPLGRLILTRDPFGIKPLYYATTDKGFAFASEPGALISVGWIEANVRIDARDELLSMQFTTGEDTIFEGIKRVLPGETLIVEKGRIKERRQAKALPSGRPIPGGDEKMLDHVLLQSVDLHQRSDVPYGLFLSGGIDSTTVLSLMARLNERPVRAFTAGFDNASLGDERREARRVAALFGADYCEVKVSESDFWTSLPDIVAALDDPAADYAVLPSWKLAATARHHGIKVILSGEGGDELFGGYGRYRSAMRPAFLGGRKMRRHGTLHGLGILRNEKTNWRLGLRTAEKMAHAENWTKLQKAQAVDCADWLPNDLLIKLDRCLMAHGVEGRTPFLDKEVARFAFLLPDNDKVKGKLGKFLLRSWLGHQEKSIDAFSRKKGFTVPVGFWIAKKGQALGELVAKQPAIQHLCHADGVKRVFSEAETKEAGFAAWTLLFYALWHRFHIDRQPKAGDIMETLALS